MIHFILYLSSSHRSEERQRRSTSRAFQRQGGRHLHRVGRGLHGGGAGETQPSEGDAAFTQEMCTPTTRHLPTLEAVPPAVIPSCQMSNEVHKALSAGNQWQLLVMSRAVLPDAASHSHHTEFLRFPERSVSIWLGCRVFVQAPARSVSGERSPPDAVFIKGASGLTEFSRVALEELH